MAGPRFVLKLLGPFRLSAPDGQRIDITSKKGMALIAMLAMASGGERTRGWLQDRLWGQRDRAQAQSSLRRELTYLRRCLNDAAPQPLLICERNWIKLDLSQIEVDALGPGARRGDTDEFLEGFDIAGEEGFEDWLRAQRILLASRPAAAKPGAEPAPAPASSLAGPTAAGFHDRPAIAVLPFVNMTGDPDNDRVCEGLSEDVIDRLARLRWLPVIARNSSFAFSFDRHDVRTIGQNLGAKYLFEGRYRSAAGTSTLAASLVDAVSGYALWSRRFALPPDRSQDTLDLIVAELVGALDAQIDYAEQVRARGKRPNELEFNDLIWRGRWHLNRLTRADSAIARQLFEQALRLDPQSPEALIQLTYQLNYELWSRRGGEAEIAEMRQMAHRAMVADPDDGRGYLHAGIAEMWLRQPGRAYALLKRAIELNPSLYHAHAQLGCYYNLIGQPADAIGPLLTAQRLSPSDIHIFFTIGELAMAHWMLGEWEKAVDYADQTATRRPSYWYALVIKVCALVADGNLPGARRAFDDLMRRKPDFAPRFIDWIPFIDRTWNERLIQALSAVMDEPPAAADPAPPS